MTNLTRDHPLSQTSLSESQNSKNSSNHMSENNNTPPPVPPALKEINKLIGQVFIKNNIHSDRDAAEKKLSDGRNPLTLKEDGRNPLPPEEPEPGDPRHLDAKTTNV